MTPGSCLLFLLFCCGAGGALVAAQEPDADDSAVVRAVRLVPGEVVRLDGVLDEAVWQRAEPATGFLQQEPLEGQCATEETEVRIVYDADALYLGVMLHDSDPSGVIGHQRQRDAGLGSDDRFMWILDTFRDGRTGYFFEINPAGLMGDGLVRVGSGGSVNKSWDGIWDTRVARGEHGWSAEIRIPFRTLNFDPALEAWGINFQRTVRRKNEETLWTGHRRNQGLFRPVHGGRVVGLQGLSQGLGLEVKPYAAASSRWVRNAPTETPADVGLDLTYSVTPSLRAALTVNTDFAETEVDDRRVNLTRFPLFFPERRQFFLEGASVYSFAASSGVNPYFSRRVGLVAGEPVPIRYGARLSGQAGAYELGLQQLQTGGQPGLPGERFTVARVKRHLFAQSSLGVIYTHRSFDEDETVHEGPEGHTVGADLDLMTSRFLGDKNLQLEAFYVVHTAHGAQPSSLRDRTSRGLRLNFPNDLWQMHISHREFGDQWDPAVGFAPRRGFRRTQPTIRYSPRPGGLGAIRQFDFEAYFEYLTDLDGRLQTRRTELTPLGIQFETGDELSLSVSSDFERLDGAFAIHPTATVPAGDYRFTQWTAELESASRRRVRGDVAVRHGQFWSGRRTEYEVSGGVRPRPGVELSLQWARNGVDLPQGAFDTTLVRVRGEWHASPWSALIASVQYDDVSRVTGLYSRYRWIVRPGSDLYFVYTHNWRSLDGSLVTLSRGGTTKINYTHRF